MRSQPRSRSQKHSRTSEQEHDSIHEGRNRSHFAWQSALQFDARAVLIMGYRHSQTFFEEPHSSETITFVRVVPTLLMTLYSVGSDHTERLDLRPAAFLLGFATLPILGSPARTSAQAKSTLSSKSSASTGSTCHPLPPTPK